VSHAVGPDHRVNILGIIALRGCGNHSEEDYGGDYLSHIINLRRQKYILFLIEIFCTFAFLYSNPVLQTLQDGEYDVTS
jgi:hypothetical protein